MKYICIKVKWLRSKLCNKFKCIFVTSMAATPPAQGNTPIPSPGPQIIGNLECLVHIIRR